jgi:hypothetical protein
MCARCVCVHPRSDKDHSTIIFEGPGDAPLLRLGWNKQDPRYIATLLADSPKVRGCYGLGLGPKPHTQILAAVI